MRSTLSAVRRCSTRPRRRMCTCRLVCRNQCQIERAPHAPPHTRAPDSVPPRALYATRCVSPVCGRQQRARQADAGCVRGKQTRFANNLILVSASIHGLSHACDVVLACSTLVSHEGEELTTDRCALFRRPSCTLLNRDGSPASVVNQLLLAFCDCASSKRFFSRAKERLRLQAKRKRPVRSESRTLLTSRCDFYFIFAANNCAAFVAQTSACCWRAIRTRVRNARCRATANCSAPCSSGRCTTSGASGVADNRCRGLA